MSNSDISIILIDYATAILAKQFHVRHGMIPPSTFQYQYIPGAKVSDYNQIPPTVRAVQIHYSDNLFLTTCQNGATITIFDSLYNSQRPHRIHRQLSSVYAAFTKTNSPHISYIVPQSQDATSDCGAFAIVNAYLLLSNIDPQIVHVTQCLLRSHILTALNNQSFQAFPHQVSKRQYQRQYKQPHRSIKEFSTTENENCNINRRMTRSNEA